MPISEPMTAATDYALALLAAWLAWKTARRARASRCLRAWAWAFAVLSFGALLGGTSHGFDPVLPPGARAAVWKATAFSVGLASYFLLIGTSCAALSPRWARLVSRVAAAKLLLYAAWITVNDQFRYVIYDYAPSLAAAALMGLYMLRVRGERAGAYLAAGVLVSFAAAGVQLSGWSLHRNFNHNDLYHVIQMAAVWLFGKGVEQLRDFEAAEESPVSAK